jgi:hypothetical protein
LTGCASRQKLPVPNDPLASAIIARVGEPYTSAYNGSGSHGLFVEKRGDGHAEQNVKFVVIRLKDYKVVHEGNYRLGGVKWKDDFSIEVTTFSSVRDEVGTKKIVNITDLR